VISDIFIEQESDEPFLTAENENGTKVSAPLKSPDFEIDIGEDATNNIKLILDCWGEKRKRIAEYYLKEKRENRFLCLRPSSPCTLHKPPSN
jgi:hypothetical protein